jgi:hypothetical protein
LAIIYSHSRLSSFEVQEIPLPLSRSARSTESIEAFVKRVHAVIEKLNHFIGRGLVPSLPGCGAPGATGTST